MNVFLSGPGGYGKSNLIKFVLDFYKIPYTVVRV
jgi:ABC-type ATPase involved in cell division